ncbi:acyl-CoA desaturase [Actinomadura macra]|uniref:acyl-CoA desaturase n=1 Tax=Actinomadura macra TaxID=46164 RepID=UPI000A04E44B|nr:fatty acid desaturase [Actinomadura macra]
MGTKQIIASRPARRGNGRDGRYDGTAPFPRPEGAPGSRTGASPVQTTLTGAIVVAPLAGLIAGVWLAWGKAITLPDVLLALVLYAVTGLGVTVGFHRLLTHRSFTARRWLQVTLAVAGSMSFQGSVIGWVATHRRHHAFTDRPGDPHSPYRYGTSLRGQLRGVAHAHLGWMFGNDPTSISRYAPDLRADRAITNVGRAFPALCALSLTLPFAVGWALSGTWHGGVTAFLWAGLIRIALLQHITWSVNSLCHVIGARPHSTRRHDRSTDLWPLALPSLGESWHNGHHSDPTCARHGRRPGQLDLSADLIRVFERLGWATDVHWPDTSRRVRNIRTDRTGHGAEQDRPEPHSAPCPAPAATAAVRPAG